MTMKGHRISTETQEVNLEDFANKQRDVLLYVLFSYSFGFYQLLSREAELFKSTYTQSGMQKFFFAF